MVDIRLISILPPQGVQQTPSISQGSAGAPGLVINFPAGSVLSGFIVNRDATGNPVLRTDSGDLTFQSNLFLKIGSEVVIRVENRANALLAHILSINGEPPETTAPPAEPANEPEVIVSKQLAQEPATAPRSAPTIAVTGVLLTNPDTAPDAPEPQPVIFKIVNLQTPQPQTAEANAATPYAAYARATPPVIPNAPQTQPTTPLQPLVTGQVITAPVVGIEPSGEPLIQTPAGIVRLQGTQLPPGSKITLEVLPPQTPVTLSRLPPAPLPELARQWTSLQQIATLLSARPDAPVPWIVPTATSQNPATPSTAEQISSGLMVFVAALRGGDFRNWLGDDNVQFLLQTGHDPLIKKAEAEFMTMVRAFTEPPAATAQNQPWQSLFFPVAVDGQLQQVRMFLKRDRKNKKGAGKPEDDTRFIVEMSLSQMGEMQLDGFVRRAPKQVEFDLFIRSLSPLEAAIQNDIQRIYGDIGQITGYRGQLIFQAVREFPVNPMKEAMAASGGVLA